MRRIVVTVLLNLHSGKTHDAVVVTPRRVARGTDCCAAYVTHEVRRELNGSRSAQGLNRTRASRLHHIALLAENHLLRQFSIGGKTPNRQVRIGQSRLNQCLLLLTHDIEHFGLACFVQIQTDPEIDFLGTRICQILSRHTENGIWRRCLNICKDFRHRGLPLR